MKGAALVFSLTMLLALAGTTQGQQLRNIVKQVDPSVVVVKTVEKNVMPTSQSILSVRQDSVLAF